MSCRLSELVIDCTDPVALSEFWCAVLGYVELSREEPENGIEIGPAGGFGGAAPTLVFNRTTTRASGKLPIHFDVNSVDRDQAEELERLLAVGARPADVGQTGEEPWHVLQDPEGNEFCLLRSQLPEL